jgi:hypothetical protein
VSRSVPRGSGADLGTTEEGERHQRVPLAVDREGRVRSVAGEATGRAGRLSVRASASQGIRRQEASVLQVGGRDELVCSP